MLLELVRGAQSVFDLFRKDCMHGGLIQREAGNLDRTVSERSHFQGLVSVAHGNCLSIVDSRQANAQHGNLRPGLCPHCDAQVFPNPGLHGFSRVEQ